MSKSNAVTGITLLCDPHIGGEDPTKRVVITAGDGIPKIDPVQYDDLMWRKLNRKGQ